MSRAEMAYQRERDIHSAQSVSNRTFGGGLSRPEPQAQTVRRPPQNAPPAASEPPFASLRDGAATSAPTSPRPAEALTPQEQARRLRHAAVTERAANLLRNDQVKLKEFRDRISAYRIGTVGAAGLIDTFFALFDTSSSELGKLIKELADIFEIPGKRDTLLKAWADWKAINEDYPSLPGPTDANATSAAGVLGQGVGASRVLKLKSSTAQSGRSVGAGQRSWNAAGPPSTSSSGPAFPSLPRSQGPSGTASPAPTPSWLALRPAAAATSSSNASSARASPAPSRNQSSANLSRAGAFPALPAARKPTSTVFSPGYTGTGVIRATSSNPMNAWSTAGGTSATTPPMESEVEGAGRGKGKKGKKQIMFQWG